LKASFILLVSLPRTSDASGRERREWNATQSDDEVDSIVIVESASAVC
jgi:hypothetical protein